MINYFFFFFWLSDFVKCRKIYEVRQSHCPRKIYPQDTEHKAIKNWLN